MYQFEVPATSVKSRSLTSGTGSRGFRRLRRFARLAEGCLNFGTSTPVYSKRSMKIMNMVFAQIDNDSGYISQNHESNFDPTLDVANEYCRVVDHRVGHETMFFSEDALLEKPAVSVVSERENDASDLSEIIEGSSNETAENFSILKDDDRSDISSEIAYVEPIILRQNNVFDDQNICCVESVNKTKTNINVLRNDRNKVGTFKSSGTEESNLNLNTSRNEFLPNNFHKSPSDIQTLDISNLHWEDNSSPNDFLGFESNSQSVDIANVTATSFYFSDLSLIGEQSNVSIADKSRELIDITKTPEKPYINTINSNISPDMFSDVEEDYVPESLDKLRSDICKEQYVHPRDKKHVARVRNCLSGVLPPPSLTVVHLTLDQMLNKLNENKHLFCNKWDLSNEDRENNSDVAGLNGGIGISTVKVNGKDSNTYFSKVSLTKQWPMILNERFHGLHYNANKLSEEFEALSMKYVSRYIGAETQSTCTVFDVKVPTPARRKLARKLAVKSPVKRLNHLAKRRITFSSANLSGSSRQVLVDARRLELLARQTSPRKRSPRKTPKKSPRKKIRTPSSSARKRLSLQLHMLTSNLDKAGFTKRALFQSPDNDRTVKSTSKTCLQSCTGSSPFKKRSTPKCALFMPPMKESPSKMNCKRKRTDSEDIGNFSKLQRSQSVLETSDGSVSKSNVGYIRSHSTLNLSCTRTKLSVHHEKKLKMAVYEALRGQNIGLDNPQFKQFAPVLYKVTKKFLPDLSPNTPRPDGGTSECMLRISKQFVSAVVSGKTIDEIIQAEQNKQKTKINSVLSIKSQTVMHDNVTIRNKDNVLKDKQNTMSNEKSSSGLRRLPIKANSRQENKVERVRKVINFDDSSGIGALR